MPKEAVVRRNDGFLGRLGLRMFHLVGVSFTNAV